MQRRVSITRLKPGGREQYLDAHRNVPPKVLERYREVGMHHCAVYVMGDNLVLITEAEDHAALDAILANDPIDREWQAFVAPLKTEDWQPMIEIFSVDL
jgi:L-rhamnose mutarotase